MKRLIEAIGNKEIYIEGIKVAYCFMVFYLSNPDDSDKMIGILRESESGIIKLLNKFLDDPLKHSDIRIEAGEEEKEEVYVFFMHLDDNSALISLNDEAKLKVQKTIWMYILEKEFISTFCDIFED